MSTSETIIDLDSYAAEGRAVPPGERYRIRVDTANFVVASPISGRAILGLVGKNPDEWDLILKLRPHGQRVVPPDEQVDLTTPGIDRFVTMKRQVTDGEDQRWRRDVALRPVDVAFLDSLPGPWEAFREGATVIVLVGGISLPAGLEPEGGSSDALVWTGFRLEAAYPDTQIDMAFFHPPLRRANGRQIPNVSAISVDGRTWQQWSRHRVDASSWRPGLDGIDTHYAFVRTWLDREVAR